MTAENPVVVFDTALGSFSVEVLLREAPATARHLLRCLESGAYRQAEIYRAVRPDNYPKSNSCRLIQFGIDPVCNRLAEPIAHEPSDVTGLTHVDGAVSMVRWEPGTSTSEFFIVIGDSPRFDVGGGWPPDALGFAVCGRVTSGMEIVRQINEAETARPLDIEYLRGQALSHAVPLSVQIQSLGSV